MPSPLSSLLGALFFANVVYSARPHASWAQEKNSTKPHSPHKQIEGITNNATSFIGETFDYVICGGGLTGLTVASRLTEDPEISILVIEEGHDDHLDPRVNDVRTYGQAFGTELDHNFTSTPVKSQDGSQLLLVAGRTLGGSGSLNGASWTKGPSSQYDILPELIGDDSWNWENFNQFMLKAEHFNLPEPAEIEKGVQFQPSAHGTDGPVDVSFAAGIFGKPQVPALEASEKVWPGLQRLVDAANGTVNGATIIPNMVETSESQNRTSPFTAYALHPVQDRDNFEILTGHRVTEIVWQDGPGMVADGVHIQACRSCDVQFIQAGREVLLAAGSLQSPQILELSGVGDPDVLAKAGVELKMAAPGVGKHMQEQTKNSLMHTPQSLAFNGSGPPTAITFPNVHQMLKENTSSTYDWVMDSLPAHAEKLEAEGAVASAEATLDILQAQVDNLFLDDTAAAEVFFTISPNSGQVGMDVWNLIVLSRGTTHISSNSSWDHPIIEPNYFDHPLDLLLQTQICKQSREVYQTEPLASYVQGEEVPGDVVEQDAAHEDWETWVQSTFTSVWHYIATLACMKEEYGGVVDTRLKVYGIENVRAIDASVLPIQLSAPELELVWDCREGC